MLDDYDLLEYSHYQAIQNRKSSEARVYPLAPYLFILVGEILNFMVKEVVQMGDIKGAMLPRKAIKNYNLS